MVLFKEWDCQVPENLQIPMHIHLQEAYGVLKGVQFVQQEYQPIEDLFFVIGCDNSTTVGALRNSYSPSYLLNDLIQRIYKTTNGRF